MDIRLVLEQDENQRLDKRAAFSFKSKGRIKSESKCGIRTVFQVDRDRILYSKAFRRLKHKTQVFLSPEGDHYRTRLTHTLEVSQIARTIARALRLNEDLSEAIALGHDLGHTPFGHAGEEVLNTLSPYGFKHNEQSLRVVDVLSNQTGLNLTQEVRDGIRNHTGEDIPFTLEGQIVRIADRIAYINHDIDDAIRASLILNEDLPKECIKILGNTTSGRIENMIMDIIRNSKEGDRIKMSEEIQDAKNELRNFMFENVYVDTIAKTEEKKAKKVIEELYLQFINNPDEIPHNIQKNISILGIERVACDYIAGMTDRFAVKSFSNIFVPKSWS